MFRKYCNSSATSLHDVYKTWSAEKEEAFNACLSELTISIKPNAVSMPKLILH
nr:MAG TPA: hypothetical protein [Caudoviricetes sp.]